MRVKVDQLVPMDYSASRWSDIVRRIQEAFNVLQSGALAGRYYASAAPTTGTWARGDIVWNSAPAALGSIGWVCVTAGTPGTWKSWGVIAA